MNDKGPLSKSEWVIYHNARCSKSCQALDLLYAQGAEVRVIDYLEKPLKKPDLQHLLSILKLEAKAIIRAKDAAVTHPNLNFDDADAVLIAISEDASLLERPIVLHNGRGVIGRPAEKVLELL